MAGVFYESNQIENALAFYDKVRPGGGARGADGARP